VSTLTKVLIVLLSVASIFLCGIIATYVANADNFKVKYIEGLAKSNKAGADVIAANEEVRTVKANTQQEKATLQAKIGDIEKDLIDVRAKLQDTETEKKQLLSDVDQATSALVAFKESTKDWQGMYENEHLELMKVNADLTKQKKQNAEATTAILEKMAIAAQLEKQIKELTRQNEQLQVELVQVFRQYGGKTVGKTPVVREPSASMGQVQPVLPAPSMAEPVSPQVKELGLKGVITQIDLKNSLAEISIGLADGVKEKMRFYATRGDAFICEILILDVHAERSVGFLERVQSPPKSGDSVSTSIGS
jgi:uncharacterized protein YhaN